MKEENGVSRNFLMGRAGIKAIEKTSSKRRLDERANNALCTILMIEPGLESEIEHIDYPSKPIYAALKFVQNRKYFY